MTKTRQWVLMAVAAAVVVLIAGWFLLVSPQRSEAAELRDAATAQEASNAALSSELAMLQAAAEELPAREARLAELQQQMPEGNELPTLIRQLTDAANTTSVQLEALTPGTPEVLGEYALIPVALTVEGTYFPLEQFIASLEELPRAFLVTGFDVTVHSEDGADSGTLKLTVNGQVFTTAAAAPGDPAAAGDAAAPAPAPAPAPDAAPAPAPDDSSGTAS